MPGGNLGRRKLPVQCRAGQSDVWLTQAAEGEQGERRYAWRNGLLNLGQGVIIPLENPLRAHIRVKGEESPLGQMLNDEGAGGRFRSRLEGGGKSQKSTP